MERRGSRLDSHGEDEGPGRRCWDHRSLHGADRAGPGFMSSSSEPGGRSGGGSSSDGRVADRKSVV